MSTYLKDLFERMGFTGLQVIVAFLIVESADWNGWWVAPVAVLLAAAKGWVAKYVGDDDSASMLPNLKVSETQKG